MDNSNYQKIGGWLYLVGAGLVISFFATINNLLDGLDVFIKPELKGVFSSHQMNLFALDVTAAIVFLVFTCYVFFLFVSKKREFPGLYIYFLVGVVLSTSFEAFIITSAFNGKPFAKLSEELVITAVRSVFYACIWIPYTLKSKRVKSTFVN